MKHIIKVNVIVIPNCIACEVVQNVIKEAIENNNLNVNLKVTECTDKIKKDYNIQSYPTTIFSKYDEENDMYKEICRLNASFSVEYFNNIIDKIKLENG